MVNDKSEVLETVSSSAVLTNCDATRAPMYKAAKNLSHEKQFFMAIKHLFKELHTYTGYRMRCEHSTQTSIAKICC